TNQKVGSSNLSGRTIFLLLHQSFSSPSVVLAYLLRILRRHIIVLVPQPELPNVLLDPLLGND
ncbi:MAG TPA: hypothetical protein VK818_04370, partial [Methylomirabilota bacterium]|nr:hypothetical protein [Methylomirabilota bacterium]